jgi:hypothetical protein
MKNGSTFRVPGSRAGFDGLNRWYGLDFEPLNLELLNSFVEKER